MTGRIGGGGGGGYNYVQDAKPSGAKEGEEWYDTGANAAYVYDGTSWIELTVVDHGQLSGLTSSNHHAEPSGALVTPTLTASSGAPDTGTFSNLTDADTTTTVEFDSGMTADFAGADSSRPLSAIRVYVDSNPNAADLVVKAKSGTNTFEVGRVSSAAGATWHYVPAHVSEELRIEVTANNTVLAEVEGFEV